MALWIDGTFFADTWVFFKGVQGRSEIRGVIAEGGWLAGDGGERERETSC